MLTDNIIITTLVSCFIDQFIMIEYIDQVVLNRTKSLPWLIIDDFSTYKTSSVIDYMTENNAIFNSRWLHLLIATVRSFDKQAIQELNAIFL